MNPPQAVGDLQSDALAPSVTNAKGDVEQSQFKASAGIQSQSAPAGLQSWAATAVALWLVSIVVGGIFGLVALWSLAEHVQLLLTAGAFAGAPSGEPTVLPELNLWIAPPGSRR